MKCPVLITTNGETPVKYTHAYFSPSHMYTRTFVSVSVDLPPMDKTYWALRGTLLVKPLRSKSRIIPLKPSKLYQKRSLYHIFHCLLIYDLVNTQCLIVKATKVYEVVYTNEYKLNPQV